MFCTGACLNDSERCRKIVTGFVASIHIWFTTASIFFSDYFWASFFYEHGILNYMIYPVLYWALERCQGAHHVQLIWLLISTIALLSLLSCSVLVSVCSLCFVTARVYQGFWVPCNLCEAAVMSVEWMDIVYRLNLFIPTILTSILSILCSLSTCSVWVTFLSPRSRRQRPFSVEIGWVRAPSTFICVYCNFLLYTILEIH